MASALLSWPKRKGMPRSDWRPASDRLQPSFGGPIEVPPSKVARDALNKLVSSTALKCGEGGIAIRLLPGSSGPLAGGSRRHYGSLRRVCVGECRVKFQEFPFQTLMAPLRGLRTPDSKFRG